MPCVYLLEPAGEIWSELLDATSLPPTSKLRRGADFWKLETNEHSNQPLPLPVTGVPSTGKSKFLLRVYLKSSPSSSGPASPGLKTSFS